MAFVSAFPYRYQLIRFCHRTPSIVWRGKANTAGPHFFSLYGVKQRENRQKVSMATTSTMTTKSKEDRELIDKVLNFWFGKTDFDRFDTMDSQVELWYGASKETDEQIRNNFEAHVQGALDNEYDRFLDHPQYSIKSDLALVVMLDQFTRNIYRGTPRAFAGDTKSREIAYSILQPSRWKQAEETLPVIVRMSFLLPLMHQESLADHDLCIKYINGMLEESKAQGGKAKCCVKVMEQSLNFAQNHRSIIERFGRYPYRNKALERQNTEEEEEFLKDGPRFGQ